MMTRAERKRDQRRVLAAGLGLSAAIHAAILLSSFSLPGADGPERAEPLAAPDGIEIVTLADVPDPAETAEAVPEPVPVGVETSDPAASTGTVAAAPARSEPTAQFASRALAESWSAFVAVAPELAETGAVAAEEDEEPTIHIPVYTRGSVGRAKAQWAASGGASATGRGRGVSITIGAVRGLSCPNRGGLGGLLP